jgi:hypothetical protein
LSRLAPPGSTLLHLALKTTLMTCYSIFGHIHCSNVTLVTGRSVVSCAPTVFSWLREPWNKVQWMPRSSKLDGWMPGRYYVLQRYPSVTAAVYAVRVSWSFSTTSAMFAASSPPSRDCSSALTSGPVQSTRRGFSGSYGHWGICRGRNSCTIGASELTGRYSLESAGIGVSRLVRSVLLRLNCLRAFLVRLMPLLLTVSASSESWPP